MILTRTSYEPPRGTLSGMEIHRFDAIVIGAGMAGASVAAHLAEKLRVILIEAEARPGYHSTGRSAALFTELYGNAVIRALTRASRSFLFDPPRSFADGALTRPRGCLHIGTAEQRASIEDFLSAPDIAAATRRLEPAEARRLCPVLREEYMAHAVHEPDSADIDVNGLHQGYLRWFRARGGTLLTDAPVQSVERSGTLWSVRAGAHSAEAPMLVDAAGAWADRIAMMAGIKPKGLTPFRRTAILIAPPPGVPTADWPFVSDIDNRFYFKPEAGQLFLSPADETPSEPCDAQPDDWDVALAVERMEAATTLSIERPKARWAGLRTFAADRSPVVGHSEESAGFFWLAGQGGYGIQTAPALSRLAAALIQGASPPADLLDHGVNPAELSPARSAMR